MLKSWNILLIGLLSLGLAACGGETTEAGNQDGTTMDGTDGADSTTGDNVSGDNGAANGSTDAIAEIPFECNGQMVAEGLNNGWQAGPDAREFYAHLPNVDSDTPVSVIFAWHGVGDTASNFQNFIAPTPDGDADFPYIMIFPQGMRLQPYSLDGSGTIGIEWDAFESENGDDNLEAALFETVVGCLAEEYTIDSGRIYHMGFSGGAIISAMMHSRYPEMVGAAYIMSGAWFNSPDTVDAIDTGMLTVNFRWDALNPAHEGTILMSHGGAGDIYGDPQFSIAGVGNNGRIISFEDSASFAHSHLPNHNRNVIDCAHTGGHSNHPQLSNSIVKEFFKAHRAGKASPYLLDGLPSSLDSICRLNP
ncbi:MAG: hypothetical protein HOI23_21640 [Deltaproteobacteria bacterium]|jgi:poly(3-hydroxybutyrate) depolymerase|nr:hypothetical protein [Deltaproteobacteria bacterium]MBT6432264.1 hypothetical protein [Deltaproteobacteria bacterium]MBT6488628.1 hypothetical protein [Deltaproteobacteria bacterium]